MKKEKKSKRGECIPMIDLDNSENLDKLILKSKAIDSLNASLLDDELPDTPLKSQHTLRLKATPEIRNAFNDLCFNEKFLEASEIILKYVSSMLDLSEDEDSLPEDVEYVIKRLVIGLTSRRGYLRQGCYTTLQVLLQLHPEVLPFIISINHQTFLKNEHQLSSYDSRLGYILVHGAIIRSGCTFNDVTLIKEIIKNLTNPKEVIPLTPVAGQFLVNLLGMYKEQDVVNVIWEELREKLQEDVPAMPFSLLWLRVMLSRNEYLNQLPNVNEDFRQKIFDSSSFKVIAEKFRNFFAQYVNVTPMVEDYFESLIQYETEGQNGSDNLASFFSVIFPLLSPTNPKHIMFLFNVTQMAIPYLTTGDQVEKVLNQDLINLLISKSKHLNFESVRASARGLMGAILQLVIKHKDTKSNVQFVIVKQLISTSAFLRFDEASGTTLLNQACAHLNVKTAHGLMKLIRKHIEESEKHVEDLTFTCALLKRMVHLPLNARVKCTLTLLQIILHKELASKFQPAPVDCLVMLLFNVPGQVSDTLTFIEGIVSEVKASLSTNPLSLSKETLSAFGRSGDRFLELRKRESCTTSDDVSVFWVMYGAVLLYSLMESDASEQRLNETSEVFDAALKSGKDGTKMTLDVLLALLSKEESAAKKLLLGIFKQTCHCLTPSSLHVLSDVINPQKEEMFYGDVEEEEEEEIEDEEEGEIEEEEEEEEIEEEEEELEGEKSEEDDEDDEIDEMSDDEGITDTQLDVLRLKMQEIVGLPMEDVDLDSAPQEELDHLDRKLGMLIREHNTQKKGKKQSPRKKTKLTQDETSLLHFRMKVCSFLEVLIEEAPSVDHLVPLLHPMLFALNGLTEDPLQVALSKRLRGLIKKISKVRKFSRGGNFTTENFVMELEALFALRKKLSKVQNEDVQRCYSFLMSSGLHLAAEKEEAGGHDTLMDTYIKHLEKIFKNDLPIIDRPLNLQTVSLKSILRRLVELSFKKSIPPYKKRQGLDMLKTGFQNKVAMSKMSPNDVKDVHEKLSQKIVHTFNTMATSQRVDSSFMETLSDLLKFMRNLHKANTEWEPWFDWGRIEASFVSVLKTFSISDIKTVKNVVQGLKQILQIKDIPRSSKKSKEEQKQKRKRDEKEGVVKDEVELITSSKRKKLNTAQDANVVEKSEANEKGSKRGKKSKDLTKISEDTEEKNKCDTVEAIEKSTEDISIPAHIKDISKRLPNVTKKELKELRKFERKIWEHKKQLRKQKKLLRKENSTSDKPKIKKKKGNKKKKDS